MLPLGEIAVSENFKIGNAVHQAERSKQRVESDDRIRMQTHLDLVNDAKDLQLPRLKRLLQPELVPLLLLSLAPVQCPQSQGARQRANLQLVMQSWQTTKLNNH